jgi:hypothetical protein
MIHKNLNQQQTREQLLRSYDAYEVGELIFLHYKCDDFQTDPCKIQMLAVKESASGRDCIFTCTDDEKEGLIIKENDITLKSDPSTVKVIIQPIMASRAGLIKTRSRKK